MAEFRLDRFKYTWRGDWSSSADYIRDDVVRFGSKIYTCILQHSADDDFYADLEAASPKWELTADGKTWTGEWQTTYSYVVGDIVSLFGAIYICNTPHTSEITAASFDPTNWDLLLESINWRSVWSPGAQYYYRDVVRYGGAVYRANETHVAVTTLEASASSWDIVLLDEDWKNDWVATTRYKLGDIIRYGGAVYICIEPHVASVFATDTPNWDIVHLGIHYAGDFSSSATYKENDIVKYGSIIYKATQDKGVGDFSSGVWEVFVPGQEFDNSWANNLQYQKGDIVRYGGNLYHATDNSVGNPPVDLLTWEVLYENTFIQGIWNDQTEYKIGDIVRYGGNVYLALADSQGQFPDIAEDGLDSNPTYWSILIPGIAWRGIWSSNIHYANGDVVVQRGSSYRCIEAHFSAEVNSPDDDPLRAMGGLGDSTLGGTYWQKITEGMRSNVLKNLGDLKFYGLDQDGSTIGATRLPVGTKGRALRVSSDNLVWSDIGVSPSVVYVSLDGEDVPSAGTAKTAPYRTIRYACENVTGPATIFVSTGVYEEILPIRVPAFVAIVGDELRSTVVKPAENIISDSYKTKIISGLEYLSQLIPLILAETTVDVLYSEEQQVKLSDPADAGTISAVSSLITGLSTAIQSSPGAITSTNTPTVNAERLKARALLIANEEFITQQFRGYLENVDPAFSSPARINNDILRVIRALEYDMLYPTNFKTVEAATYFINGNNPTSNKLANMFLLRDGTGLRNMTLSGLEGILLPGDTNPITRRPTGGAFASLDPGWGPADSTAWVGTKSPYVQNVTTFGEACVGLKIDGELHNGGNQTIVANDFTQIISDGIGVWANKTGKTEVVSVFTYYNHIGYMCTNGGKIRGTNGNCSYGNFGALSEGVDPDETPITCVVNNRYYDSSVSRIASNNSGEITNLFYSNAGQNYTSATATVTGNGFNAVVVPDELRDGSVYEVRITDPGDSSAAGGSGYVYITNASQGGDQYKIIISGADENTPDVYRNMRLVISRGTGVGQYGYIAEYDDEEKTAYIAPEKYTPFSVTETDSSTNILTIEASSVPLAVNDVVIFTSDEFFGNIQTNTIYYIKEIVSSTQIKVSTELGGAVFGLLNATGEMLMHKLGWEHFTPGYPIESTLDSTTNYDIEPRLTFTTPGFTSSSITIPTVSSGGGGDASWQSMTFGDGKYVAVASNASNAIYSSDGSNWNTVSLGTAALWNKVKYVGGKFVAVASNGIIAVSDDATSWTLPTVPALEYADVAYGAGKWIFVAQGGTSALSSTDLSVFTTISLPEGADWNAIEFGKDKFVIVSLSDSSSNNGLYSTNGTSWTAFTLPGSVRSLAFGNNRFVAISGGYSGAEDCFISFNGINWQAETMPQANYTDVAYGQGIFMATATGESFVLTSKDGLDWNQQDISSGAWSAVSFGSVSNIGKFIAIGGTSSGLSISTGAQTQARVRVVAGRISLVEIFEPGSGYSSAPALEIIDPNNSSDLSYVIRTGNGVLANPTMVNGGDGYAATATTVSISGDGFRDEYQLGEYLIVDNLSRLPGPGDNVEISSINDYTYKLLSAEIISGTFPNARARLRIAKDLDRAESPDHGTSISIRQLYSQVRLTGHDFLDLGLGNFEQTNYPDTLFPNGTVLAPENEVIEREGGRVFYTSTDQDGNFRVGELFEVEQSTGTVTLNAQFFDLGGLEEIALGGVTVGGSGVVIREFSTDPLFTADSNNIIPTEKAIKAFLNRRVSGGGSDAITGFLSAGVVQVGPQQISSTTGGTIDIDAKINFKAPIDGTYLAQVLFMSGNNA